MKGIDKFRGRFAGHEGEYVLIGGGACDLLFGETQANHPSVTTVEAAMGPGGPVAAGAWAGGTTRGCFLAYVRDAQALSKVTPRTARGGSDRAATRWERPNELTQIALRTAIPTRGHRLIHNELPRFDHLLDAPLDGSR